MNRFVTNLKALMHSRGWNPTDLSRRCKVSRPMIVLMFSGDRTPTINVCEELAKAFGLTICQVLEYHLTPKDRIDAERISSLYLAASEADRPLIMSVAEKLADRS